MGKKSSPAPPDYRAAAEEQSEASREITEQQTWANRPDQFTPFGSQTWEQQQVWDPATEQYLNRWAQTTQLDPMTQWALDNQQYLTGSRSELGGAMMDRAWDEFGRPMDWNQLEDYGATPDAYMMDPMQQAGAVDTSYMQDVGDPGQYRDRAEQAYYDRSTSRLDPQWSRRQGDLEQKLVNQGLRVGDEAYDRAMEEFGEGRTDAYQSALNEAIMAGGGEAQRQFGMDIGLRGQQFGEAGAQRGFANEAEMRQWQAQRAQYDQMFGQQAQQFGMQNQLRQQQMVEEMQRRGFSLNEINALISGQQVGMPQMPGFTAATRSETPQYMDAAQQGYMGALQQSSSQNAMGDLGGLFSFGASVAPMFSDRRLKRNIERIGTTPGGVPWYRFEYIWGESSEGVMADEVPWAATKGPGGFAMVDYARIT